MLAGKFAFTPKFPVSQPEGWPSGQVHSESGERYRGWRPVGARCFLDSPQLFRVAHFLEHIAELRPLGYVELWGQAGCRIVIETLTGVSCFLSFTCGFAKGTLANSSQSHYLVPLPFFALLDFCSRSHVFYIRTETKHTDLIKFVDPFTAVL